MTINTDATGLLVGPGVVAKQIATVQEAARRRQGRGREAAPFPRQVLKTRRRKRGVRPSTFGSPGSQPIPQRGGRDAGQIADEVIQHLLGLQGANVRITLKIQADFAALVRDAVVCAVSEDCRAPGFEQQGFEEE